MTQDDGAVYCKTCRLPVSPLPLNERPHRVSANSGSTAPVWITVVVTAFAGLLGLIPASLHAAQARSVGQDGGRYYRAFGMTFLAVSLGYALLILVLFLAVS